MPGVSSCLAAVTLPAPHDYLAWIAPILTLMVIGFLVLRTDCIMHYVFPDLEWERNLGWLNIRAERRAQTGMRWVGYAVLVLLFDSLVGILWAAKGLPRLADWSDPWIMGELALRVPALGLCLLIWVIYLGCGLLPRLRAEREAAAFKRFRAEMQAHDEDREMTSPSRVHPSLPKPRTDAPALTIGPGQRRHRHPPGG